MSFEKAITQNNKMGNSVSEDQATGKLKKNLKLTNHESRKSQKINQYTQ